MRSKVHHQISNVNDVFRKPFRYSEFFILYAVPLVLLTVLYSIMSKVLWGGRSASYANEAQQMAVLKLRRSVVKMLIISMLIYFVCYSPIQGRLVGQPSRRFSLSGMK